VHGELSASCLCVIEEAASFTVQLQLQLRPVVSASAGHPCSASHPSGLRIATGELSDYYGFYLPLIGKAHIPPYSDSGSCFAFVNTHIGYSSGLGLLRPA